MHPKTLGSGWGESLGQLGPLQAADCRSEWNPLDFRVDMGSAEA